jgi:iron transport multicopper oxidase
VHDPDDPYKGQYDEELILTTSDWYHDQVPLLLRSMLIRCNTQLLPPFPDSVLLNDTNQANFLFSAGKTYKISVISMAALGATFLQFESHTMRVIGVDGTYVKMYNANQIRIAPAQRYTFLLSAKPTADRNYAFLASLDINKDFVKDSAPVYKSNITGQIKYNLSNAKPPALVVHKWEPVNDFNFEAMDDQHLLVTPGQCITLDFTLGFDALGIPR